MKTITWAWVVTSLGATGFLALRLHSNDRRVFLPNETTSGHYQIEISCNSCHTPFGGVQQQACLNCHEQELKEAEDSHPKSKFTDPRNADRVARLDARFCVTCHVEHRPASTHSMGVTMPVDYCFHCHSDIGSDRPSHMGMAFESCASAGCHNFHDNRALYKDFLIKNVGQSRLLDTRTVPRLLKALEHNTPPLTRDAADGPEEVATDTRILDGWSGTAHSKAGVNCTGCHNATPNGLKPVEAAAWVDRPDYKSCQSCHQNESNGFLLGKHGMRLAAGLTPMSPSMARLPMQPEAHDRTLSCTSCHAAHEFNTRSAAVDACLECHADKHSLAYKASPHFALWRMEIDGSGAVGSGVSCATCHLPREMHREAGADTVSVQHNQNANLRPNEKMIRGVCMSCHGLAYSIDALADSALIETNFTGSPARHIASIDMAVGQTPQGDNR